MKNAPYLQNEDVLPPLVENFVYRGLGENVNLKEQQEWIKGFISGYFYNRSFITGTLPFKFIRDIVINEYPNSDTQKFITYINGDLQITWSGVYIIG